MRLACSIRQVMSSPRRTNYLCQQTCAGTIARPMMRVVQRRSKLQFVTTNAHGVLGTAGAGCPSPKKTRDCWSWMSLSEEDAGGRRWAQGPGGHANLPWNPVPFSFFEGKPWNLVLSSPIRANVWQTVHLYSRGLWRTPTTLQKGIPRCRLTKCYWITVEFNVFQLHSWIEKLASRRPFQRERERESFTSDVYMFLFY